MQRGAVGQRYDTQISTQFGDEKPVPNAPVGLDLHGVGLGDCPLAPLQRMYGRCPRTRRLKYSVWSIMPSYRACFDPREYG